MILALKCSDVTNFGTVRRFYKYEQFDHSGYFATISMPENQFWLFQKTMVQDAIDAGVHAYVDNKTAFEIANQWNPAGPSIVVCFYDWGIYLVSKNS